MILYPSHAFREANDCHIPAGTPAGGRFCGKGEVEGGSVAERINHAEGILRTGLAEVVNAAIEKGFQPDYMVGPSEWQEQAALFATIKDVSRDILDQPGLDELGAYVAKVTGSWTVPTGPEAAKKIASLLLNGWSTSSMWGDFAVALQLATKDQLGLSSTGELFGPSVAGGTALYQKYGAIFRRVIEGQYARTQRFFAERGVTELTLLRGVTAPTFNTPKGEHTVRMKPLESFTSNHETASQFGTQAVLVVRVPVSQILSTGRTGFGTLVESEFVVLGGERTATVYPKSEWKWPPS